MTEPLTENDLDPGYRFSVNGNLGYEMWEVDDWVAAARVTIDALTERAETAERERDQAITAHVKITTAMRCGGRVPENAIDTMKRLRERHHD